MRAMAQLHHPCSHLNKPRTCLQGQNLWASVSGSVQSFSSTQKLLPDTGCPLVWRNTSCSEHPNTAASTLSWELQFSVQVLGPGFYLSQFICQNNHLWTCCCIWHILESICEQMSHRPSKEPMWLGAAVLLLLSSPCSDPKDLVLSPISMPVYPIPIYPLPSISVHMSSVCLPSAHTSGAHLPNTLCLVPLCLMSL